MSSEPVQADTRPLTEVAAAVMLRRGASGQETFLLAQRPEGKVYAGYWEFPGGKLEPGEDVRAALVREIREELGVEVTACAPWLTRTFSYPHALVRLHFWSVTAWQGELGEMAPVEHAAVTWVDAAAATTVSPMLPANAPILKALALPRVCGITRAAEIGCAAELSRLDRALRGGLRWVLVREPGLAAAERHDFAEAVAGLARAHQALLVVHSDESLARAVRADGLHLTARQLAACAGRPEFAWVGASCHDAAEIARAGELGLDYAFLGPVLPTASHPETQGIGWSGFAAAAEGCFLPVLALGGLTQEDEAIARAAGAHGVAMMRAW